MAVFNEGVRRLAGLVRGPSAADSEYEYFILINESHFYGVTKHPLKRHCHISVISL